MSVHTCEYDEYDDSSYCLESITIVPFWGVVFKIRFYNCFRKKAPYNSLELEKCENKRTTLALSSDYFFSCLSSFSCKTSLLGTVNFLKRGRSPYFMRTNKLFVNNAFLASKKKFLSK